MVLQAQEHAALLGRLQTSAQAINDPLETILIRVTFDRRLDATVFHQLVEILARVPGPCIDAHGGNAKLVSELDAMNRVIDILLPLGRIGIKKSLMDRQTAQIEAEKKGPAFEFLKILVGFVRHLTMQEFDSVEAHVGGEINARLQAPILLILELPKGVGGQGNAIARPAGRLADLFRLLFGVDLSLRGRWDPRQTDRGRSINQKSPPV